MASHESRQPVRFPLPLTDGDFQEISASGPIVSDRLLVFLERDVYDFIREKSRRNDPHEVGGALLGQYCKDGDTRFVIASVAVPCELGPATPVSISFPPEFWQKVEEIHTNEYPGLLRLGPYHSHPGYGVYPSGTDQTTILAAFTRAHHVSVIYDPRDDEMAYTCWQEGQLMPPVGLFVFSHASPENLLKSLMEARTD